MLRPSLQGFPGQPEGRKAFGIRCFEGQLADLDEVQPCRRRGHAPRPDQGHRDGVRISGEPRCARTEPSAIRDHGMDDRLRVDHDDVDLVLARLEQVWKASISSRPLFISVAESTEILAPIDQLGCATACAGVAASMVAISALRNGPPDAVRIDLVDPFGLREIEYLEDARCARNRPAAAWRRDYFTSLMNSSPAQTRHSLLASATMAPRCTAASVGASPPRRRSRPSPSRTDGSPPLPPPQAPPTQRSRFRPAHL